MEKGNHSFVSIVIRQFNRIGLTTTKEILKEFSSFYRRQKTHTLMASTQDQRLHFIMFPFMAQGHTIPMIDMARLFAQRGITITIVTTPVNALRFNSIIERCIQADLPIRLLQLRFPSVEAGVPEGCENYDTLPSRDLTPKFMLAVSMLQEPLEKAIGEMEPKSSCIISDMLFPWTNEVARKFDIPRFIFHGISCFSLLCSHNVRLYKPHEKVAEMESFIVPGVPDRIEIRRNCLPSEFSDPSKDLSGIRSKIREAEDNAYGVVINSFDDLEASYVEEYRKVREDKVWCLGPVSLCNKEELDKAERGYRAAIEDQECLQWLDTKEPNSVVYVCLGSLNRLTPTQLVEIGLGLEASNHSFVWVIRQNNNGSEFGKWLSEEKFEERVKDRGLLVKGWAPQVLILSHPAIGAFMTHCGWNSTLEGVCAGVPLLTLPLFAEQFFNEKLVVEVLGIGYKVAEGYGSMPWGQEEKAGVFVKKEDVEKAVSVVIDEGDAAKIRKKNAREVRENAQRAMEDVGCSYVNMTLFIENIMQLQQAKFQLGN